MKKNQKNKQKTENLAGEEKKVWRRKRPHSQDDREKKTNKKIENSENQNKKEKNYKKTNKKGEGTEQNNGDDVQRKQVDGGERGGVSVQTKEQYNPDCINQKGNQENKDSRGGSTGTNEEGILLIQNNRMLRQRQQGPEKGEGGRVLVPTEKQYNANNVSTMGNIYNEVEKTYQGGTSQFFKEFKVEGNLIRGVEKGIEKENAKKKGSQSALEIRVGQNGDSHSAWWLNVKVECEGVKDGAAINWLVDTGASGTIISRKWLSERHRWHNQRVVLWREKTDRAVRGVSGKTEIRSTEVQGWKIRINTSVGVWHTEMRVNVTDGLSHPPLLGMDNLQQWNSVLELSPGRLIATAGSTKRFIPLRQLSDAVKTGTWVVRLTDKWTADPSGSLLTLTTAAPDAEYELVPKAEAGVPVLPCLVRVVEQKLVALAADAGGTVPGNWLQGTKVGHLQPLISRRVAASTLRSMVAAAVDVADELVTSDVLETYLTAWRATATDESDPASRLEAQVEAAQQFVERKLLGEHTEPAEWRRRWDPLVGWDYTTEPERQGFIDLLVEFADVFEVSTASAIGVECEVATESGRVVNEPVRPLHAAKKEAVLAVVDQWERLGIVEIGQSAWNQPLVVVRKPTGKWRVCLDLRQLNAITKPIKLAVPSRLGIQLEGSMRGAKFFSTMDLKDAFLHIPVRKEDREKFAFQPVSAGPKYVVNRMMFGFVNAPAIMQSFMVQLCGKLEFAEVLCYLDDLLTWSHSFDDHLNKVRAILGMLRSAQLTVGWQKCRFLQREVPYLGRMLCGDGMRVDPDYVKGLLDLEFPMTARLLESVLASFGWLRDFIPHFEHLVAPLRREFNRVKSLVPAGQGKRRRPNKVPARSLKVVMTGELADAWKELKQAAASASTLRFPQYGDEAPPFVVEVDASDAALFGVLKQDSFPLAYFAKGVARQQPIRIMKQFTGAVETGNQEYARELFLTHAYERELGALVLALQHFEPIIWASGVKTIVQTDHKPLTWLATKAGKSNRKYFRWQQYLTSFPELEVVHVKGEANVMADMGSRLTPARTVEEVEWLGLEKESVPLLAMIMTRSMAKAQAAAAAAAAVSTAVAETGGSSPVSTPVSKAPTIASTSASPVTATDTPVKVTTAPATPPRRSEVKRVLTPVRITGQSPQMERRSPVKTTLEDVGDRGKRIAPTTTTSSPRVRDAQVLDSTRRVTPIELECEGEETRLLHPGLHCICKQPDSLQADWVGCDRCELWFHPECVGVTDSAATFLCPHCEKMREFEEGRTDSLPADMWVPEESLVHLVALVKANHRRKGPVVEKCLTAIRQRVMAVMKEEKAALKAEKLRIRRTMKAGEKQLHEGEESAVNSSEASSSEGPGATVGQVIDGPKGKEKVSKAVAVVSTADHSVEFVRSATQVKSRVIDRDDGTYGVKDEWFVTTGGTIFVWVDVAFTGVAHWALWVPEDAENLQARCIRWAHTSELAGHGGVAKTEAFLAREFWWGRKLRAAVATFVGSCVVCIMSKQLIIPSWAGTGQAVDSSVLVPNERVCGDFMVMTPCQRFGGCYVLVDSASRLVLLVPLESQTSENLLSALRRWYWRYGLPQQLHVDNFAPQAGGVFSGWCRQAGVHLSYSATGNSGGNGIVERTVRTAREVFRTLASAKHMAESLEWVPLVEQVMAVMNHQVHSATNLAPLDLFPSGPRRFLAKGLEDEDILDDRLRGWHLTSDQKQDLRQRRDRWIGNLLAGRDNRKEKELRVFTGKQVRKKRERNWNVGDVIAVKNRSHKVTAGREAHHLQVQVPLRVTIIDEGRKRVYGLDVWGKPKNYSFSQVVKLLDEKQGELLISATRRSFLRKQIAEKEEFERFLVDPGVIDSEDDDLSSGEEFYSDDSSSYVQESESISQDDEDELDSSDEEGEDSSRRKLLFPVDSARSEEWEG